MSKRSHRRGASNGGPGGECDVECKRGGHDGHHRKSESPASLRPESAAGRRDRADTEYEAVLDVSPNLRKKERAAAEQGGEQRAERRPLSFSGYASGDSDG